MTILLDAEPVVLEELDFETPCEGNIAGEPCPHPARWSYWWSCSCISPYCQVHHEGAQECDADGWWCDAHDCAIKLLRFAPLEKGAGL